MQPFPLFDAMIFEKMQLHSCGVGFPGRQRKSDESSYIIGDLKVRI